MAAGDDRPAAPGPLPPGSPGPLPPPPIGPPTDDLDEWDEDPGELPDDLFDREWPDDEDDDGVLGPPLADEAATLEPDLAVDDEDGVVVAEDESVDVDLLEDLAAADDTDIPVIDPELMVKLDGRTLPARVDWARPQTVWVRPAGAAPDREVTLDVSGRRLVTRVSVLAGDQELVLLGRDLLKGRFLLRA
jgi:hypothetical protein